MSLFKAGITAAIAIPQGSGVVIGQSTLFYVGAKNFNDAVVKEVSHIRLSLGNAAKESGVTNSVSGQFSLLRKILFDQIATLNETDSENISPFSKVVLGELGIAVEVSESDDILKLIALKKKVEKQIEISGFETEPLMVTIVGGAEAWAVTEDLVAANIRVHLKPARCVPSDFERQKCKVPSSVRPTSIEIMKNSGVKVSMSAESDSFNRNLFWEAGWARADTQRLDSLVSVSEVDAVGFVTWNAVDAMIGEKEAKRLGVGRIVIGTKANLVAFNGSPLIFGPKPKVVVTGKTVVIDPQQE
ncbi:hypothetical protein HK096_011352 [Nowakowskiella sp. JEL0078]|nr:hypothetical protein HK096_011352 [Nowakowskiella sp. JEL0078]